MTLDLRYVASCDRCPTKVALETRSVDAAKRAYQEAGWRLVVEDKGRELLCVECLAQIDRVKRDQLVKSGHLLRPEVKLARPRPRQGFFPCSHCGDMVAFDQSVIRMGRREHIANLVCIACGVAEARRRGYTAIVDIPTGPDEDQPAAVQQGTPV